VAPTLQQEFGYGNPMEIPRLDKVVLNVGLGEALQNANALEATTRQLATISGQKPVTTKAKKSIAGFKLREGNTIGAMVTLRSHRMYEFVDRLLNAALPRIRDFHGVPRSSFDGRGNYSLGIREQVIFPEIDYNQVDRIRGFQVTFTTTAKSSEEAFRLLELLGMPFARVEEKTGA
jgi:large subunit ribosomal protein L5